VLPRIETGRAVVPDRYTSPQREPERARPGPLDELLASRSVATQVVMKPVTDQVAAAFARRLGRSEAAC